MSSFRAFKPMVRRIGEKNGLFNRLYLYAHNIKVRYRMNMSDEEFAQDYYRDKTGKELDLNNPKTFDEKLWYLKLHYRNPLMTKCSDKLLVRKYVEGCGLQHVLNENYGAWDDANKIDFASLPMPCFVKCNHTSGINYIIDSDNMHKIKRIKKELNFALGQNYYFQSREWNYKDIYPMVIAEKILYDENRGGVAIRL